MSDKYWLLLMFSFLAIVILLLVGLPVLSLILGLLLGFLALALGFGTPEHNPWGEMFINFSKFFWNHWLIMIIAAIVLAVGFLQLAKYLKKKR